MSTYKKGKFKIHVPVVTHPKITILCLFLLFSFSAYGQGPPTPTEVWTKGIEASKDGDLDRALNLWKNAVKRGLDPDPRIGFSYIEMVTSQELRDRYKEASAIYFWGLSGCTEKYTEELELELERLKPITGNKTFKQWRRELKDDPVTACESLVNFWELTDLTVTTKYNERLVEHWERIAYAQKNYNRNTSSAYDADERALVYVKLGEPDHIRSGTLHFNNSLVRGWAQDGMELQVSSNTSLINPLTSAGGAGDSANSVARRQEYLSQMAFKEFLAENVLKEARLLHRYPYYEIWVYREVGPDVNDNIIYIFGEDGDTGEFRMQRSLEDMIPNSAFRRDPTDRTQITPGLLLQMLFYEQTSIADNFFADAFQELEKNLFTMNSFNPQTSFMIRSQKTSQLRFRQYKAPREKSTYLEALPDIGLNIHQYRMLDENSRPYLATFVESQPHKAYFFDQLKSSSGNSRGYRLYHYVKVENAEGTKLKKQGRVAPIYLQGSGNINEMESSQAYFKVPNISEGNRQVFSAELHDVNRDSTRIREVLFPSNIRGIGKLELEQPKPLSDAPDKLEVSEILLGVDQGEEALYEKGPTSFKVLHDNVIPANENMMIHLEVYNLTSHSSAPNQFEVEYQVNKRKRSVFQRLFGGSSEKVRLTLNFETFDSFHKNDLEVATAEFEPGKYRLSLIISEPHTGQNIKREIEFEIEE